MAVPVVASSRLRPRGRSATGTWILCYSMRRQDEARGRVVRQQPSAPRTWRPGCAAARAILEQRPLSDRASGRPHWSLFRVEPTSRRLRAPCSEPPFSSSTRVARTKRGRGMFYQILGQMESPTGTLNITLNNRPARLEFSCAS